MCLERKCRKCHNGIFLPDILLQMNGKCRSQMLADLYVQFCSKLHMIHWWCNQTLTNRGKGMSAHWQRAQAQKLLTWRLSLNPDFPIWNRFYISLHLPTLCIIFVSIGVILALSFVGRSYSCRFILLSFCIHLPLFFAWFSHLLGCIWARFRFSTIDTCSTILCYGLGVPIIGTHDDIKSFTAAYSTI